MNVNTSDKVIFNNINQLHCF